MTPSDKFVVETKGVCKTYVQGRWWQKKFCRRALDDVNLSLRAGGTLAVVGKSGSGKTTLAMCLVGLEQSDAGRILLEGQDLSLINQRARSIMQ
jgi:ABC-type oligopeptide transport system ATPase subunit